MMIRSWMLPEDQLPKVEIEKEFNISDLKNLVGPVEKMKFMAALVYHPIQKVYGKGIAERIVLMMMMDEKANIEQLLTDKI